jgi:hypothetical protein
MFVCDVTNLGPGNPIPNELSNSPVRVKPILKQGTNNSALSLGGYGSRAARSWEMFMGMVFLVMLKKLPNPRHREA